LASIQGREEEIESGEKLIDSKIEQIQKAGGDYSLVHREQKAKRLKWWEENRNKLRLSGSLPRQAYQLLLLEYLKLKPEEVPIVYEDGKKVVYRSFNFCPVLEACQKLGLDTREVCRKGYEQSVQDLISCLDPCLKFSRNYQKIRPYADYCEETIELKEA